MDQKHEQTKKKLKIVGLSLVAVGGLCTFIGMADFFMSFGSFRAPTLFFLCFIGMPMLGIGGPICLKGFQREIQTYAKNESVPVFNEMAPEIAPAITTLTDAVREGVQGAEKKPCPYCGDPVEADDKFCPNCGKPLSKTCPQCGEVAEADDRFCGKCGSSLTD